MDYIKKEKKVMWFFKRKNKKLDTPKFAKTGRKITTCDLKSEEQKWTEKIARLARELY